MANHAPSLTDSRAWTETGVSMVPESHVGSKLRDLKRRLKQENPVLEHVVDSFRELDRISRRSVCWTATNPTPTARPGGR